MMFLNNMEDGRRNPGSKPWTFKTRENPGLLTTVNTNSGVILHHIECGEINNETSL
jgi:hypothetical protein